MSTDARHISGPRFLLAGDAALVVEFGDEIDPAINRRVHALARALAEHPLPGLGEAVPTYRSLLVHYDPWLLSYAEAEAFVSEALQQCEDAPLPEPRLVEIPTVYGGEHGPDIGFVAEHNAGFHAGVPLPGRPAGRARYAAPGDAA
jgi:inhibitor of KinA